MTNTSFQFDHLVVAVDNLETAVVDYTRLGFQVTPGGRHTHSPTRNALVYLQDGAYFELIEWLVPALKEKWYERLYHRGEGIIDFALCPAADFAAQTNRTDGRYDAYGEPVAGSRVQADGVEIRWWLGWPVADDLPFLCADVTPRGLRVPEGACREHPNGVTGIHGVSMQVTDIDAAVHRYERLLTRRAERIDDADPRIAQLGLRVAVLSIGGTRLHLVAPRPASDARAAQALTQDLAENGSRVYRVTLTSDGEHPLHRLDSVLTHGASLWVGSAPADLDAQIDPLI